MNYDDVEYLAPKVCALCDPQFKINVTHVINVKQARDTNQKQEGNTTHGTVYSDNQRVISAH